MRAQQTATLYLEEDNSDLMNSHQFGLFFMPKNILMMDGRKVRRKESRTSDLQSEHQIWSRELIRKYQESHSQIWNVWITYQETAIHKQNTH